MSRKVCFAAVKNTTEQAVDKTCNRKRRIQNSSWQTLILYPLNKYCWYLNKQRKEYNKWMEQNASSRKKKLENTVTTLKDIKWSSGTLPRKHMNWVPQMALLMLDTKFITVSRTKQTSIHKGNLLIKNSFKKQRNCITTVRADISLIPTKPTTTIPQWVFFLQDYKFFKNL